MAAPPHELTWKNAQFNWGPEQEEAFKQLKERLTTAPVLGVPWDEGTYYRKMLITSAVFFIHFLVQWSDF